MINTSTVSQVLKSLLDGNPPNGTKPADLGDWRDVVQALYDAHDTGGTDAVRRVYAALAVKTPGLIALVSAEESAHPGGMLADKWQLRTLKDAYEEREPWAYVVDGLIQMPSLGVVYGGPGSLKSMVLADLCVCVASGTDWLEPLPGERGDNMVAIPINEPLPVLWIDFDNGTRRTDERIEAMARTRDLPVDTPIHYVSMPRPWLDISQTPIVAELASLIKWLGAKFVVIDNLGLVTGDTEENGAGMAQVMGNLRWLCEDTGSAVFVIHHQRKSSGMTSGVRKGESLRGHSSIEAALDLALLVERKEGSDDITIIPTKVRGYNQFDENGLGAFFTYEHREGTYDLARTRFWRVAPQTKERKDLDIISDTIFEVLRESGSMLTETLINAVRDDMASQPGGKAPGINRVRGLISKMVKAGELVQSASSNKRFIGLP